MKSTTLEQKEPIKIYNFKLSHGAKGDIKS